jgi:hypothetical protein
MLGIYLRRKARTYDITLNSTLRGAIDLGDIKKAKKSYANIFDDAYAQTSNPTEIMVHPGSRFDPHQISGHDGSVRSFEAAYLYLAAQKDN